MTDPLAQSIVNQMWGVAGAPPPGAPAGAPADAMQIYQGADKKLNGFTSWWVWDLRSPILKLCWDLLRFQKIDDGKGNPDRTVPVGLRDSVNEIRYKTDRALAIAELLAAKLDVDISKLP
jgi:hypothetical protein